MEGSHDPDWVCKFGAFLATTPANAEECAPFTWGSVDVGGIDISQGAIIVGVNIEGIGRDIPLQLDTGSATTELYGEAVPAEIMAAGKQPRSVRVEGWSGDGQSLPIAIRPAEGAAGQTVGTLGTDAFPEGFILDLEHQRICKMNVLNNDAIAGWQTLTLVNGSPVIEATEDGAAIRLLLDTGSSGFSLLSTRGTFINSPFCNARPAAECSFLWPDAQCHRPEAVAEHGSDGQGTDTGQGVFVRRS